MRTKNNNKPHGYRTKLKKTSFFSLFWILLGDDLPIFSVGWEESFLDDDVNFDAEVDGDADTDVGFVENIAETKMAVDDAGENDYVCF